MLYKTSLIDLIKHNFHESCYAFRSLFRFHPWSTLLTIAVIAVSFAIPSIFYLLVRNATEMTQDINLGRSVTVYISPSVDELTVEQIRSDIAFDSRVATVEVISQQQALQSFAESLGVIDSKQLVEGENPLPYTIIVHLKEGRDTTEQLDEFVKDLEQKKAVDLVRLDKQWLLKLNSLLALFRYVTYLLAGILMLSLLLTVINTISNRVLLHANEIEVMKLMGATNSYIYRPYFYLGMWLGVYGAVVGWWITIIALFSIQVYINDIAVAYNTHLILQSFTLKEMLQLLLASVVVTTAVSLFSAQRSIAHIEPK